MKRTQLTSGAINGADQLSIELGEPDKRTRNHLDRLPARG
jgi:hypothetical protein